MKMFAAALFLSLAASSAHAKLSTPETATTPVNVTQGSFEQQRKAIETGLSDGRYAEIRRSDREEVLDALDRMEATLAGVQSIDELSPDARVALFNDQEMVNNVLTKAERDSRIVCSRRHRAGSHFKETSCQTLAERDQRQREDQDALRDSQRVPQLETRQ